jgi:methylglutaconyl-CoA hydratase
LGETIGIGVEGGVATLRLARPGKRNAMSRLMIDELTQAAGELGADPAVRAVVLAAEGDHFCAGGDLAWMREQMDADAEARAEGARALAGMLGAIDAMPKPVIGRVQGPAFGGGLGLIAVCDVAVAVQEARFAFTETRLGLVPATIGPYVLARMGGAAARRVFMSGRSFGAREAVRLGLLAAAVLPGELDAAVAAQAEPYLKAAPGAVASAKALARSLGGAPGPGQVEASVAALVERWESEEAAEGIAAFFDRRPPPWA